MLGVDQENLAGMAVFFSFCLSCIYFVLIDIAKIVIDMTVLVFDLFGEYSISDYSVLYSHFVSIEYL